MRFDLLNELGHGAMQFTFYIVPYEVHDRLENMKYKGCETIYMSVLRHMIIVEFEEDDEWIKGRFRESKQFIKSKSGVSQSHFYECWVLLEKGGLIEKADDGSWILPYYRPNLSKCLKKIVSQIGHIGD